MDSRFKPGDIVQHFKRELLGPEERETDKYLYEIIGIATHSETGEPMMVYRPLYDDCGMYVRPFDMFLSEVDHEKYPDVRQKYRFEKVPTVSLDRVYEAVEMASFEGAQYLDVETSEIIGFPEDYSIYDEDNLEELEETIAAEYGTRYYRLPEQYDIRDGRIVEAFIQNLPAGEAKDKLRNAFRGRGAFRRFRDAIYEFGIEQDWYKFRDEAYRQIARDWCEKNGIRYTE